MLHVCINYTWILHVGMQVKFRLQWVRCQGPQKHACHTNQLRYTIFIESSCGYIILCSSTIIVYKNLTLLYM